jgi:predicted nucleic acid-binding protein
MNDKVFLDTNIVVYLYSDDEKSKQNIASRALDKNECVVSTQILNEASNVWFKKYNWSAEKIRKHIDNIERVCDELIAVRKNTVYKAIDLKEKYEYSFFDCLMLASALESDCDIIYTEDMSDGQIIGDTLKIVNPFKEA